MFAQLGQMLDEADGNYEATLGQPVRRCEREVCKKVVANSPHDRGYGFRDMGQSLILTPEDVQERFKRAKKYKGPSLASWMKIAHVHLGNHVLEVGDGI